MDVSLLLDLVLALVVLDRFEAVERFPAASTGAEERRTFPAPAPVRERPEADSPALHDLCQLHVASGDFSSGIGDRVSRAASLAAGTAGELAKGVGAKMAGKLQDRVSQTAGGRLATSIRESMAQQGSDDVRDNSASDAADANGSAPSFASDSLSGANSGGWVSQSGGFSGLSSQDQLEARQAHAQWQALDPQQHTSGLEDFVSEAQMRQQECNDEIASFVNRDRQEP